MLNDRDWMSGRMGGAHGRDRPLHGVTGPGQRWPGFLCLIFSAASERHMPAASHNTHLQDPGCTGDRPGATPFGTWV